MDDKIYVPEIIEDQPFPLDQPTDLTTSQQTSNEVYGPIQTIEQEFPPKRIAVEVIGNALNTRSRKILSEFQFTQSGALQIGKYENGVSGDVRISPIGIVARDSAGNISFSLDGESGDAVFRGRVQAGSLLSGDIVVGGTDNENGGISVLDQTGLERVKLDKDGIVVKDETNSTIIDATGLVSSANFNSGSVTDNSDRTTSGSGYSDISNTSLTTVTFARPTVVLIMYTVNVGEFVGGGSSVFAGHVTLRIDSTDQTGNVFELQLAGVTPFSTPPDVMVWSGPLTAIGIVTLTAGSHTLKLRADTVNSNSKLTVHTSELLYLALGK